MYRKVYSLIWNTSNSVSYVRQFSGSTEFGVFGLVIWYFVLVYFLNIMVARDERFGGLLFKVVTIAKRVLHRPILQSFLVRL